MLRRILQVLIISAGFLVSTEASIARGGGGAPPRGNSHGSGVDGSVRDHTTQPVVRDHRAGPDVRDHREKPVVRDHRKPRPQLPVRAPRSSGIIPF
jgi:hypothetical protein